MAGNLIPNHLRSDHLFLLIGANTLPNWVAAQLLVKPAGTVHLAYTSKTREHARRLKETLEEEQKPKPEAERSRIEWFETVEADAGKIFDDVWRRSSGLPLAKGRVIGLHYTGGTKMMSVHAHRAIRHAGRERGWEVSFSYLDARSLQMKFDPPQGSALSIALDERVRIGLEKLLRLHDDYSNPDNIQFSLKAKGIAAAQGLVGLFSKYAGQIVWQRWSRNLDAGSLDLSELKHDPAEYQRHAARLNGKKLLTEADFSTKVLDQLNEQTRRTDPKERVNPPDVPRFQQRIVAGYRQVLTGLQVSGGDDLQTVVARSAGAFADSLALAKWFEGLWLEHYTFSQLQSIAGDSDLNQNGLAINLETVNDKGRKFEADVIALRGCQLFYLTCYTGNKKSESKDKLFEGLERAAQLGGDEAKVGLICNTDAPATLKEECEEAWGSFASNQIEVFGRAHLPDLAEGLKRWFRGE